jgi:flagellar M-ring protein FliF
MPGMKSAIDQLKQFWASRSGRQRAMLLGGVGATAAIVVVFVRMIGTPDYKPLFTGLEPADAQALSAKLDEMGIAHQVSVDGKTLSVPADKLDLARMQTASDSQPHSGRMGFELFDKTSWGQTEFDEKVNYQRALEGELERSIQTLADVDRARVHLVMATDSAFADRQRDAKASVILKLHRGTLSKDAAMAIARLVSGAVDGLKPEDVSIVDADSARSLGASQSSAGDGPGGDSDLSARLIKTLEPVVGADKIRASVNVEYDQGATDESQEKYDPSVTALLSVQRSEDQAGGAAVPAGVPGTASNVSTAQAPKPATPPTTTQSSKTESAQYGVNRTVVHTVTPAGQIERITAAILVDDATVKSVVKGKTTYTRKKRSAEEMNQIRELAQAVIGFDAKRGDSITVQNLAFDVNAADLDSAPITWASQAQKAVSGYSPILRPVSLLVLFVLAYLFLLRPVQKQVLVATPSLPAPPSEPMLPAATTAAALPGIQPVMGEDAMHASRLREGTAELVKQKPLQTTRALQAWLREETT